MRPAAAIPIAAPLLAALLLASLLLAPLGTALDAIDAQRCRDRAEVPCGAIYPRVLIEANTTEPRSLDARGYSIEATLAFEFDPMAEGLALDDPRNPIFVTFEFPRKPAWASLSVEPKEVPVPIQPQHLQADPSDPQNPRAPYRYTAPITITVAATSRAVLPDGADFARLYVFAKSTESGLYKPGYGIRELKVAPIDPLHEADLGPRVVRAPLDPPPFPLADLAIPLFPHGTARVEFPDTADLWRPTPAIVTVEGADPGTISAALLDASGHVVAQAGPSPAPLAFNLTFPNAGRFRLLVLAGAPTGVLGAAEIELAPPPEGAAWRLPRDYRLLQHGTFSRVAGSAADPAAQDERLLPIPVYEGASGAEVSLAIGTAGTPLDRGGANVNVAVLDPTGAVLHQGTVDPANPAKRFPVGALPGPGLYHVRVFGTAAPTATWSVAVQVVYDKKPLLVPAELPWRDAPARVGVLNATLEVEDATAWMPATTTLRLLRPDGTPAAGAGSVAIFALDATGRGVQRTETAGRGLDALAARLTFPQPGAYDVVAVAESDAASDGREPGGTQFGRGLIVRRVLVDDPAARVFRYPAEWTATGDAQLARGSATPIAWKLPVFDDAGPLTVSATLPAGATATAVLYDEDGQEATRVAIDREATLEVPGPGTWTLVLQTQSVAGGILQAAASVTYPAGPIERNPVAPPIVTPGGMGVPGAGLWGLLAAVGVAGAVGWRRGA